MTQTDIQDNNANKIMPDDQISALLKLFLLLTLHKPSPLTFQEEHNTEIRKQYLKTSFLYYIYCSVQNLRLKYFYLNQVDNFQVSNLFQIIIKIPMTYFILMYIFYSMNYLFKIFCSLLFRNIGVFNNIIK